MVPDRLGSVRTGLDQGKNYLANYIWDLQSLSPRVQYPPVAHAGLHVVGHFDPLLRRSRFVRAL